MDAALDLQALLSGYASGWFPMDVDGEVGFYETDPRAVIPVDGFRVPRSVRRALRDGRFTTRIDAAFDAVVDACGGPRHGGAWLTPRLAGAYRQLHRSGYAHSIEIWSGGVLAGGLFGVALGGLFTSESMFHHASDAGSAALVAAHRHLRARGYLLWDIQMASEHTERFGAIGVTPGQYRRLLRSALAAQRSFR